jgi:hypothetical protein
MAPMHEWKDDAEFIRYNQPEKTRWWHPIANFLGGVTIFAICASGFALAIYAGASQGNADCWRGTARSYDSESPNARLIDVELNYARRHPECQKDWTPQKRQEAERYWRYSDTLDQADRILNGAE